MAFASSEAELSKAQEDGRPLRAHLYAAYQTSGELPELLANAPELPTLAGHVWEWFCELNAARGSNGFSLVPITYRDILEWSTVTRAKVEPWEVKALRLMDMAYCAKLMEKSTK